MRGAIGLFAAVLAIAGLLSGPPARAYTPSGSVFCNVMVISGGSVSSGVTATPSGGTLCVNSGSYSLGASTITLSNPITIAGYPGGQSPFIATGAAPVFMPALTQTSGVEMFSVTGGNVTFQGLAATGTGADTSDTNDVCDTALFAEPTSTAGTTTFTGDVISHFTCGIEGNGITNPMNVFNSIVFNDTNVGIGCSACVATTNSTWSGNVAYNTGVGQTGPNAYAFVASYAGTVGSQNITVQNNQCFYNPLWECYDDHGGSNLTWNGNLSVGSSGDSADHNHNAAGTTGTIGIANITVENNVIDNGFHGTTLVHDSIDVCAYSTCTGTSGVSGTNTVSGNVILSGSSNGCVFTHSSSVTVGTNTCGVNPETVSSITLSGFVDGTANAYTHGQPNHTIATVTVNMSNTYWSFPMPPGTLTISGTNSCGLQILGNQLVQKAAGGSPAATCNDFTITATLPGMDGSPYAQTGLSITGQ